MTLKRTIKLLKEYLRMNKLNVIELTNVNKYRLDEINKIRDYFNNEINERKIIIKKLNKYIVSFVSFIWYVKYNFTRFSSRHTSRYCRLFF